MGEKLKVKHLDTRKMVKQGGSLYISIPSKFCKDNDIVNGTSVDVFSNDEGSIIILRKRETKFSEES